MAIDFEEIARNNSVTHTAFLIANIHDCNDDQISYY